MNKVTVFVQEHLSKTSFQGPLIEKQYCFNVDKCNVTDTLLPHGAAEVSFQSA